MNKGLTGSIKEQSLTGFKWNAIGQYSPYFIRLIISLFVARLLEPADYGAIGMLSIFMAVSQSFVDSGFGNALIRKKDRTEEDCSTAFFFNIVIAIILYTVLFFSAPFIAEFYNMPVLKEVTRVLSLIIIINSLGIVPISLRSVAIDFKSQAYASVLSVFISGCVGLYLAYIGYGVWALVWQSIVASFINVGFIWALSQWRPIWVYSWRSFRTMFSYGSKLMASGLLNTLYRQSSSLIIGKCYTPSELGYYDRGYQIASLPSIKFSDVLHGVTYPIMAKLEDDKRLLSVYYKYLAITSMVVFFIMTFLSVTAKPLIVLLLTEKWIGIVPFLRIFCLAFMFDSVCRLNNNILFIKGWSGLFFKLEVIKKSIVIPFLFMAIPYGVIAISFVAVLHTLVDITCSTYCLKKYMGVEMRQYRILVRFILLSVFACFPAYLLCGLCISPWISLSASFIIAFPLYYWFLHKNMYMKEFIQSMLSVFHLSR